MPINTEVAVAWFEQRRGKVTYSMTHRDGPTSYDCSSALYYALRAAGASAASWAVNTESAHNWLIANGYALIAENRDWNMQRGDVIIWGRKGHSIGSGGHAMLAIDSTRIIHCSYGYNGININNYDQYYGWNAGTMGGPYVYVYRQKTTPNSAAATKQPATTHRRQPVAWKNWRARLWLASLALEIVARRHLVPSIRRFRRLLTRG